MPPGLVVAFELLASQFLEAAGLVHGMRSHAGLESLLSSSLPRHPYEWVASVMANFPRTWALCGGWAVDAWLGEQSREHGDVDITIFDQDQRVLFEHLAGWHMLAGEPEHVPWRGDRLGLPGHIHARPPDRPGTPGLVHDGFDLEIILNGRSGGEWVLSDDPRIMLPVGECASESPAGIPTAMPEILMFFKATAYPDLPGYPRPRDYQDFLALRNGLSPLRRRWLRNAIAAIRKEHPWLADLI